MFRLHRHAATTFYQLQRGFGGRRQHALARIFCQFYLVLSLFYSLQSGSNGFIAEILYLYFTKDPEGVHYFPGGGGGVCKTLSRGGGPNANFFRNPCAPLLFSRGVVRTPYPPLDPHMGNVIITGLYLSQSRF